MHNNPVGWFEIPATNLQRAKEFYEALFGISLRRQDIPGYEMLWFPAEQGAPGIAGALMRGMGYQPSSGGVIVYFNAPDIDAAIQRALALGSKLVLPKKDLGDYGYIAWIVDSEGNTIALHSSKSS